MRKLTTLTILACAMFATQALNAGVIRSTVKHVVVPTAKITAKVADTTAKTTAKIGKTTYKVVY